jgi:two-component system alkaline phosphatase synthesis response regulator PhoP
LEKAGYKVFKALDGEVALKILAEEKPDLVLLDLILPKKDGFEFLEEMRSHEETKNTPVVILTNLEEKFDIEKALSYGVRAYLVKANYRPQEIIEKINEILK